MGVLEATCIELILVDGAVWAGGYARGLTDLRKPQPRPSPTRGYGLPSAP